MKRANVTVLVRMLLAGHISRRSDRGCGGEVEQGNNTLARFSSAAFLYILNRGKFNREDTFSGHSSTAKTPLGERRAKFYREDASLGHSSTAKTPLGGIALPRRRPSGTGKGAKFFRDDAIRGHSSTTKTPTVVIVLPRRLLSGA